MFTYSAFLLAAEVICITSIVFTVLKARPKLPYWPTISEAGAMNNTHIIYATGMVLGSIVMETGFIIFIYHSIKTIKSYGNKHSNF